MKNFKDVYSELRRKNIHQYLLLLCSTAFSVLLITAYLIMMSSKTVLTILPEGGDSRKQVMMIFVLAVIGCVVFINYAIGLFLRYKSRETGIFMALGSPKSQIRSELFKDVGSMMVIACIIGLVLATPLAFFIWQIFKTFVVNTEEMVLTISANAFIFSGIFSLVVIGLTFYRLQMFINRANIIDILNEARKSEPIKEVPRWYGVVGILLMILGGVLGYSVPGFIIVNLHYYPPEFMTAFLYLPALIGLYMIMLHTVVNGWRAGANRYKNIVSNSMMKFEGRQTVRNLIVITVLVAGAYFASFYAPLMTSGASLNYENSKVDYSFNYRADQDMISESEIRQLAKDMDVVITDYKKVPIALLAVDGNEHIEEETKIGATYRLEYVEAISTAKFLSESNYFYLTGESVNLAPGEITTVYYDDGTTSEYYASNTTRVVTNYQTGEVLDVTPTDYALNNTDLFGYKVIDDGDYERLSSSLSDEYREELVFFNVEDVWETYAFANALFNEIVDRSNESAEVYSSWDPIAKDRYESRGEVYYNDNDAIVENGGDPLKLEDRNTANFRMYWKYMPKFRVLDKNDMIKNMAVFLMLFVFIAIICFASVMVITYTRSLTIGLNNAQIFYDLRRLGANNMYLRKVVKGQISKVFFTPISIGTIVIFAFYMLILYGNSGGITAGELSGIYSVLGIIAVMSGVFYVLYKFTYKKLCTILDI